VIFLHKRHYILQSSTWKKSDFPFKPVIIENEKEIPQSAALFKLLPPFDNFFHKVQTCLNERILDLDLLQSLAGWQAVRLATKLGFRDVAMPITYGNVNESLNTINSHIENLPSSTHSSSKYQLEIIQQFIQVALATTTYEAIRLLRSRIVLKELVRVLGQLYTKNNTTTSIVIRRTNEVEKHTVAPQTLLDYYYWTQLMLKRESGELPLWEGIRIVKEVITSRSLVSK